MFDFDNNIGTIDSRKGSKTLLICALLIGGFILLLAFSLVGGDVGKNTFRSPDFSTLIENPNGVLRAELSSGGSQVSFALTGEKATKTADNTYILSDNTKIYYEVLKGGKAKGLKETITVYNPEASNRYTFDLTLKDVKRFEPNLGARTWHFYNAEGKEVFYIPTGFMVDAKGQKSDSVDIGITQVGEKYTLTVTADEKWLKDPERSYPVDIDPSVIVSGTIADTEAQFGGLQKKVAYVNSNWYAFYTDGTDVLYKKSSDGSNWGSAVDVDSSDADNINPTTWVEGNYIYVAWIDDSSDAIEVNRIDTASSDALGTKCTSADQGTIDTNTFTVALTVVDDGTVYFAYSDTSTDTEVAVYKLVFSGCTFTDITTGSGLTAGDRPVLTSKGSQIHMIFQDGDLSASAYDGTAWITGNEALASVTDNFYDVTTDGYSIFVLSVSGSSAVNYYTYTAIAEITDIDTSVGIPNYAPSIVCLTSNDCKIAYQDDADADITFADCNDSACSSPTITDIDIDIGANATVNMACPTADDCKVVFNDGTDQDITFADCNDATCSAPTITDIDTATAGVTSAVAIHCPSATDCKVVYSDGGDLDITFVDCNNAACSSSTITDIDTDAGTSAIPLSVDIYCPTADDCKVVYYDGTDLDITFVDCNNAACSSSTITDIDTDVSTSARAALSCPSATDCKVVYYDLTDQDISFADCNDATCSAPTITDIDTETGSSADVSIDCPAADNCKVFYVETMGGDNTFVDCDNAACSTSTIRDIDTSEDTSGGEVAIYCIVSDDCRLAYSDGIDSDTTYVDCNDETCTSTLPPSDVDIDTDVEVEGKASVYCPAADDCKVVYYDDIDLDITFADCNDAACSAPSITDIDTAAAGTSGQASIYCPAADDCKVAYYDDSDEDISFADCNDATCSAPTITDIDNAAGTQGQASIYCPLATDCKVAYFDDTDQDITFADCNDATCSAPTISDIDTAAGTSGQASIYCPSADDCKVAFLDSDEEDITFADCNDATCSAPTITDIDTAAGTQGQASIYCPSADDCKVAYFDDMDGDITFADCNDAKCSAPTITDIDTTSVNGNEASIYCPSADDCKVAYFDSADGDITFADCNDAACSAPTITDIDIDADAISQASIYCPSADDCKVAYFDRSDQDITFADCNDATCSTWTSKDAPWNGQTNITSLAASYTDMKLYAATIMDSSEQAYWKVSNTSNPPVWSAATSFGFTNGDLGQIAIYFNETDDIEAVLRQGSNLEFSDQYNEKIKIQGKTIFRNKNTFR